MVDGIRHCDAVPSSDCVAAVADAAFASASSAANNASSSLLALARFAEYPVLVGWWFVGGVGGLLVVGGGWCQTDVVSW